MKKHFLKLVFHLFLVLTFTVLTNAQALERTLSIKTGGTIQVKNLYGRIDVKAISENNNQIFLKLDSQNKLSENDLQVKSSGGKLRIEINPKKYDKRIDVSIQIPVRTSLQLETDKGQISVAGDIENAEAKSNTGTIYADVPLNDIKYKFLWSGSRPRIISDVELEAYKEKSAGKFIIKGFIKEEFKSQKPRFDVLDSDEENTDNDTEYKNKKNKTLKLKPKTVSLNFRTVRGIISLNVPPNEVPSDLTDRPLTNAAKAIIKSGDSLLTAAIRRASPKYFGEYAATLPPRKSTPFLKTAKDGQNIINTGVKKVNVQVLDINNRAVYGLGKEDFNLTERGEERQILSVEKTESPFNLVLLLDVSGSIEHYVDFIRKAARNFVRTVSPQDKLSIVIFNEDVKTISTFTTDKYVLSESLDTFDAGGGTAYYDSIAYVLTDTLRPMQGERTAIVVLSDGDDNRSFLPFKSLLGSIQESGALVYPLYVPSGLIAASTGYDLNKTVDPLRNRFLSQSLTSKAQEEGETLAKISGGVYYPISRLSELQNAYDDIVKQLRTAYTITYRSNQIERKGDRGSPRLKVKVKKDNTFVKVGKVFAVNNKQVSNLRIKDSIEDKKLNASLINVQKKIRLTSSKIKDSINLNVSDEELELFTNKNQKKISKLNFRKNLFQEARDNNFTIIFVKSETSK